jgi:hypothetical protein
MGATPERSPFGCPFFIDKEIQIKFFEGGHSYENGNFSKSWNR